MSRWFVFSWWILVTWGCRVTNAEYCRPSFQISFRRKSNDTYVRYSTKLQEALLNLTVCFWMKPSLFYADQLMFGGTVLSYFASGEEQIWAGFYEGIRCRVGLSFLVYNTVEFNYNHKLGEWLHVCFVRNADGNVTSYLDGIRQTNASTKGAGCAKIAAVKAVDLEKTKIQVCEKIPAGGEFTLGQESKKDGSFHHPRSWVGDLSEVHLWSRTLSPVEVAGIANCSALQEGNVLSWGNSGMAFYGELAMSSIPLPCKPCS